MPVQDLGLSGEPGRATEDWAFELPGPRHPNCLFSPSSSG